MNQTDDQLVKNCDIQNVLPTILVEAIDLYYRNPTDNFKYYNQLDVQ